MRKSTTQETPFVLAFGIEAVAPVEIGLKPSRIELASVEHNEEALCLNSDLLDEIPISCMGIRFGILIRNYYSSPPKRDQVLERTEDYQRKTARYYDQKVKPRSYKLGDLVLKKLLLVRKNQTHGKLGPNWEGPYIVSRIVRPGNYKLQT